MRIAVDARAVFARTRRGTGKNLVDLYSTLASQQPVWDFVMFHQLDAGGEPFAGLPNVRHVAIDLRGDRWNAWQDVRLPLAARAVDATVLHCPANTAPWLSLTPVVLTIHDLIPLEAAPDTPATRHWVKRVRRSARRARRIITPSNYSRHAIVLTTGVPDARITVNYWAPDRRSSRIEDEDAIMTVRRKYQIPDSLRYVLAFGAADTRKNTAGIIEAWSRVAPEARRDAVLLFVGLQPAALERFTALAAERVPDRSCLLRGFAAEEDMAALTTGALALCYPSRSEGFGLPVLDAFVCGTPLITSTSTSLPEVAGDAALLVDPDAPEQIAGALTQLLVSEAERQRLRAAGFSRLTLFSWERCARTVGQVFEAASRPVGSLEG
jgi:glycosyltransferase involved in cell wall biosynthesis